MDDEKILREYLRNILREEFGDYGYGSTVAGITPWTAGYGGSTRNSRGGYGSSGSSLWSIFVDPFVQATKVIAAEFGQVGTRLVGLLATAVETALDILVPKFKADFDLIQKRQDKIIQQIRVKYRSAYEAVDDAWDHPDIALFSFLHDPTTWLTYQAITAKPQQVLSVFEMLVQGNEALALYLRDIRNRLGFGRSPTPEPIRSGSLVHEGDTPTEKTPAQLLADVLTSKQFKDSIASLPIVREMRADAEKIERDTSEALQRVTKSVVEAKDAGDLSRLAGGSWKVPSEYQTLSQQERETFDDVVTRQIKASMATYYESRLRAQVEQLKGIGIDPKSPHVRAIEAIMTSLTPWLGASG